MWKYYLLILSIGLHGCTATMPAPDKSELLGSWMVESIGTSPVMDRSPAFIQFAEDGKVGGNSSCNRSTTSYTLTGSRLTFAQVASTRMMCLQALMEQEQRFLAAMAQVAQVQLENGMLELMDADGNSVCRASRHVSAE